MHGYGVNLRYLGLVLERASEPWLKAVIMAEVAARSAKCFLKFDLQDCTLNLNETSLEQVRKYHAKQAICFLNKLLGNSEQTEQFWAQLSRQSQHHFGCYLDRTQLNVGFLIQSL